MPTKKETKAAAAALANATAAGPVPNCTWTNNSAACLVTWKCLGDQLLSQFTTAAKFEDAGTVQMSGLALWKNLNAETRKAEAGSMADMITKISTTFFKADYEPGQNYGSAVEAIKTILLAKDKTVCELAAVVDEQHKYPILDD